MERKEGRKSQTIHERFQTNTPIFKTVSSVFILMGSVIELNISIQIVKLIILVVYSYVRAKKCSILKKVPIIQWLTNS